ncbi:MAG TPA: SDR family oxidoreductase, partial [Trebonia sp.]|nr:SDR family oxidoreductase [Trebonia sp.]
MAAGRGILVTGGSRGIGAAIARAFAAAGDLVAVHYRDAAAAAEAVRDELPGDGHAVVRADLADAEAVRVMVDEAAGALGGLDVLVNNAGVYVPHPVTATSYEEWQDAWRATLGVNLVGAANATWCAVRHMTARGGGRVVNVGSRGAFRGEPAHPAYGASKAGLHAFGQSLAVALAPHGITVASVAPGYVVTDMTVEELGTPAGDVIRAQSPFNRVALPEEVAAAVIYLASPEAAWASGAVLDLNGASYLRLARYLRSARAVFGEDLAGDRAVPDVRPVPEAEPLPRAEERGRLVVDQRNRHLGAVPRVQRLLVVPAQLRREAPGIRRLGKAAGPDHEGVRMVRILPRDRPQRRPRPPPYGERLRLRRHGIERDQCPVPNLAHSGITSHKVG